MQKKEQKNIHFPVFFHSKDTADQFLAPKAQTTLKDPTKKEGLQTLYAPKNKTAHKDMRLLLPNSSNKNQLISEATTHPETERLLLSVFLNYILNLNKKILFPSFGPDIKTVRSSVYTTNLFSRDA